MIIIITTTGMMLAGLIYLLCVPVYFEIGYDIEQRELESCSFKLYPFSYRIRPKIRRNKGLQNLGIAIYCKQLALRVLPKIRNFPTFYETTKIGVNESIFPNQPKTLIIFENAMTLSGSLA